VSIAEQTFLSQRRSKMKKGMPMREAYRKVGLKPEEMDWASMGMDIKTCAKEMNVRPRKYVCIYGAPPKQSIAVCLTEWEVPVCISPFC